MNNDRYPFQYCAFRYVAMILAIAILQLPLPSYAISSAPGVVTGKLVDAKGNAPLTSQTIYIADFSTLSISNKNLINRSALTTRKPIDNSVDCEAPKLPYKSYTCTTINGEFSLATLVTPASNSKSQQLVIVGQKTTITLTANKLVTHLGNIALTTVTKDKIAIVSITTNTTVNKHISSGQKVRIPRRKVVSYLFDSEILSGYGLDMDNENIEYYRDLQHDDNGRAILDSKRFSTILVIGSWQDILAQHSVETVSRMLQFVEQGGRLLIKDNKTYSNTPPKSELYI